MRAAFGPFTSLLDFCRRIDRDLVDRRALQALIKVGAFGFTGLPRAQLAMAEQVYSATGDLLRAADRNPTGLGPFEEELAQLVGSCRAVRYQERVHPITEPNTMHGTRTCFSGRSPRRSHLVAVRDWLCEVVIQPQTTC